MGLYEYIPPVHRFPQRPEDTVSSGTSNYLTLVLGTEPGSSKQAANLVTSESSLPSPSLCLFKEHIGCIFELNILGILV